MEGDVEQMSGSSFGWLKFDKDGGLAPDSQGADLRAALAGRGITDLVVLSHGWKTDEADARQLYATLWANVVAGLKTRQAASIVVAGIEWPSKAYETDFDGAALSANAANGTLSVPSSSGAHSRDFSEDEFRQRIAAFEALFEGDGRAIASAAEACVLRDTLDPAKAAPLFAAARAHFDGPARTDTELRQDAKPLAADHPHQRLLSLLKPPSFKLKPGVGAAKGLADAVGEAFSGPRAAIARFLNQLTYFEMKRRSGTVGRQLGASVIPALTIPAAVRLHLVGHSFGARLVTAAASALPASVPLYSLALLQGAFSHNALAEVVQDGVPGAFANVVGRPTGPIVMTHTHNDKACTFWYAMASRLSRDTATALGDKDDLFGAMGANGAQRLKPEALAPDVSDTTFRPVSGRINRFLADGYVVKTATTDAHNNVTNPEVGRLLAAVLDLP